MWWNCSFTSVEPQTPCLLRHFEPCEVGWERVRVGGSRQNGCDVMGMEQSCESVASPATQRVVGGVEALHAAQSCSA